MNVYNTLKVTIIYLYDIKEIVFGGYYKKRELEKPRYVSEF